jgi:hypothetical protein
VSGLSRSFRKEMYYIKFVVSPHRAVSHASCMFIRDAPHPLKSSLGGKPARATARIMDAAPHRIGQVIIGPLVTPCGQGSNLPLVWPLYLIW